MSDLSRELDKPDVAVVAYMCEQREEAAARLRSLYEAHLARVKSYRRGWATPRCYLSCAPGHKDFAANLAHDLQSAGVHIVKDPAQVKADDHVVVLDSPGYQKAWKTAPPTFVEDINLVRARMAEDERCLISIVLDNQPGVIAPHNLGQCTLGYLCDATHYPASLFDLVLKLYAIPLTHAVFLPLRESLHRQWEEMAGKLFPEEEATKAFHSDG